MQTKDGAFGLWFSASRYYIKILHSTHQETERDTHGNGQEKINQLSQQYRRAIKICRWRLHLRTYNLCVRVNQLVGLSLLGPTHLFSSQSLSPWLPRAEELRLVNHIVTKSWCEMRWPNWPVNSFQQLSSSNYPLYTFYGPRNKYIEYEIHLLKR